jgi:hypothetical protein
MKLPFSSDNHHPTDCCLMENVAAESLGTAGEETTAPAVGYGMEQGKL